MPWIRLNPSDVDIELSDSEVELVMNRTCLNILQIQEDEEAKVGNVARHGPH